MEKIKTILDRKQLSSEQIRSKQDFANVVNGAKGLGKPYWQTNWFYGTVGVATVAIIVTAVTLSSSDAPDKDPKQNNVLAMSATNDEEKNSVVRETLKSTENQKLESSADSSPEVPVEENNTQPVTPEVPPSVAVNENPVEESVNNTAARTKQENEVEEKKVEAGLPNVAGVSGGPIAFKDFCDPLGIQVNGGVLIHQYTIQYRSCARDITARIRGNRLPDQVCDEIRDCGSPIEVTFSNFKAEDRDGNPVQLKEFSLTTHP